MSRIREQAQSFGAEFVSEKVLRVDLASSPKQVWTGERSHMGRAVIIATGAMGRTNRIAGEERLVGRGVSYCAICDAAFFRDQEVAVAGGNDEAVEEALSLARFASRVHVLAPEAQLRASDELIDELRSREAVTIHHSSKIKEIRGENQVEAVDIIVQGEPKTLPAAGVFIYLQGNVPITDFLSDEVATTDDGCLVVDDTFQANVGGVFAVGDVLCKHVKQAVIAAAEGVEAAIAVDRYIHGREQLRPDWSH